MQALARYIKVGWGSSGYYSKKTLKLAEREAAFPSGIHLHWNHPTRQELKERPERDLNTLAAESLENAYFMVHPKHGAGLYARVRVFSDFQDRVKEKGRKLSILANGSRKPGEAPDGNGNLRKGLIVERIYPNQGNNVDFVTHAGAGGQLIFESADNSLAEGECLLVEGAGMLEEIIPFTPEKDDFDMTKHVLRETHDQVVGQLTEAKTRIGTLEGENEQLKAQLQEAKNTIALTGVLAEKAFVGLKDHERKAVISLVTVPLKEGGEVDLEKLREAVTAEAKPFMSGRKGATVKGLGDSGEDDPEDAFDPTALSKLAESIRTKKD